MRQNANTNRAEIKKVLQRKDDKMKFVIIPKKSSIKGGDYVLIKKVEGVENARITN